MSKLAAIALPLIALAMFAVFYVSERLPANNHIYNPDRAIPHYPKHAISPSPLPEFCSNDAQRFGEQCAQPIPPVFDQRKASEFDDKNAVDY